MSALVAPTVTDALVEAARDMLGPGVVVAGGRVADWTGVLWPVEEKAVERAVPVRRQEFAAGRTAARRAMAAIGLPPSSLPRRLDGPPCWPDGVSGSLSHGGGHVLVAVGRLGQGLRALGLDIEPDLPLSPDVAAEVCRPDEDQAEAIRVFGAKEAAYKAQYMLTGRLLDHAALRIRFDAPRSFTAEFMTPVAEFAAGARLPGRQALVGPFILSTIRIG